MQLATVVTINDLGHMTGIVESVKAYDDLTVYGVRTLDGTLYARTADELGTASQVALLSFVRDLRILAAAHAELAKAVDLLDADEFTYNLIEAAGRSKTPEQIRAWYVRHGLDKLAHLTAADILAARDADHEAALDEAEALAAEVAPPVESPLDVMRRIGRETGQPVVQVAYPAAPSACLHAGCHPGRCVYGPDHGTPAEARAPRARRRNRLVVDGREIG